MRNIEVDVERLVETGLVVLKENEYIRGVTPHQFHGEGSKMSFWVEIEEGDSIFAGMPLGSSRKLVDTISYGGGYPPSLNE